MSRQSPSPLEIMGIGQRTQVLLLGTFHFATSADYYKPSEMVDIMAHERQAEVQELTELLAIYRPTRIVLEQRLEVEERLNQQYREYRAGEFALKANEIYQIGFRLAAALEHERVYCMDEWGRMYDSWDHLLAYIVKGLGLPERERTEEEQVSLWEEIRGKALCERYRRLYQHDEQHRLTHTLREHLLYLNGEERIRADAGSYLFWQRAEAGDYTLADHISGWWYNRNLRMFSNIRRIPVTPDDRVLVIVGAAHVPILRHAFQCSPEYELAEVATYLSAK